MAEQPGAAVTAVIDHAERDLRVGVAVDLYEARKREGACPMCGGITPACTHVVWAMGVLRVLGAAIGETR